MPPQTRFLQADLEVGGVPAPSVYPPASVFEPSSCEARQQGRLHPLAYDRTQDSAWLPLASSLGGMYSLLAGQQVSPGDAGQVPLGRSIFGGPALHQRWWQLNAHHP